MVAKALRTVGLSPKTVGAFFAPVLTAFTAALTSFIVTGAWNVSETRTALAGAIGGVLSGVAAYLASPGTVTVVQPSPPPTS